MKDPIISMGRVDGLLPYLLPALIDGLAKKGFTAYPSLFTSCVQLSHGFESKSWVEFFLAREPEMQRKYLTLVPVIYHLEVVRHSVMRESMVEIRMRLELYPMTASGGLGTRLLAKDLSIPFEMEKPEWENLLLALPLVEKSISSLPEWDSVAVKLPALAQGLSRRFDPPKTLLDEDTGRVEKRERGYFSQSEIVTNLTGERNRISKSDFLCLRGSGHHLSDLAFPFQAGNEYPILLYAYILNPNHHVVRINLSDGHVEQSPESLPTKVYDWSRVFVVNLPGLEPGAVVSYAVQFRDRVTDTLWTVKRHERIRLTPPIARDMEILSRDQEPFRLGVWTDAGDTVRFAANQAALDSTEAIPLAASSFYTH